MSLEWSLECNRAPALASGGSSGGGVQREEKRNITSQNQLKSCVKNLNRGLVAAECATARAQQCRRTRTSKAVPRSSCVYAAVVHEAPASAICGPGSMHGRCGQLQGLLGSPPAIVWGCAASAAQLGAAGAGVQPRDGGAVRRGWRRPRRIQPSPQLRTVAALYFRRDLCI